jgi:predicted dehydrogenase
MVAISDWFFGTEAEAALGSGGVYRWKDGREVPDHTYATLEYPGGRTAVFTSIESNAFDHYYEAYYGTRGTLILRGETEAYLFDEGALPGEAKPTTVEVTPKSAGPAAAASESRTADAAGRGTGGGAAGGGGAADRLAAYRYEIDGFCGAVRTGSPLKCTPERALGSANACISAFEAIQKQQRVAVPKRA